MKRILPTLILVLSLLLGACRDEASKNMEELSQIAAGINEKCPKMLDSETRFDGIDLKEPNTLIYRYTLVNLAAANVDTTAFYQALWPGLISNIKVSAEMKKLRENNTSIEYLYRDKAGLPIYTFRIAPADYK